METIEQYLSILKELKNIEIRIQRLVAIFQENGRQELDDLIISGLNIKANELAQAAQMLSSIQQVMPTEIPSE